MLRLSQFGLIVFCCLLIIGFPSHESRAQSLPSAMPPDDWDTLPNPYVSIMELYDSVEAGVFVDGSTVRVHGEYVNPTVSILVDDFFEYLDDDIMPVNSSMLLQGSLPDSLYFNGGSMVVTGGIVIGVNPNPREINDTLLLTIFPDAYQYLHPGWPGADSLSPGEHPWNQDSYYRDPEADDCDSCKFAILVSSMGTRGAHGGAAKPTYWENIVNLRRHKIDNEGYCESNIFVHFADGISDDATQIPNDQVKPATEASIDSTHDEVARRIAACKRDSTDSKVQKMFTNHGSNDNGVVLWRADGDTIRDHRYLSPEELTAMQQKLIDSCCKTLIDEFVTCYGGDMLNGLLDIDNMSKTQIHANSAAPDYAVGWSPSSGGHAYLNKKIECLSDTTRNYEECVREAEEAYYDVLRRVLITQSTRLQKLQDSLVLFQSRMADLRADSALITPESFEEWRAWYQWWINKLTRKVAKSQTYVTNLQRQINGDADGNGQGCPSWVRHSYHQYCEWKEFVAEPGGQLTVDFTGPPPSSGEVGCGNVTIWERMSDGTYRRARQWNWNLPGGFGYLPGAERRVLHVPPTGTGEYFIHNDDGEYTIDVHSLSGRPDADEDPSNDMLVAGFSLGGVDGSPSEFGFSIGEYYETYGVNVDGVNLADIPGCISAFEGVGDYKAIFLTEGTNQFWDDMEVVLNILDVGQPGTIDVSCPVADIQLTTLFVEGPGEYRISLGAIDVTSPEETSIRFTTSFTGASFCWDAWSLRSLVPKYGDILLCCGLYTEGFTGNIDCDIDGRRNLTDITRLIDRVYLSKSPLCCEDSGNVDGDDSGKLNLSDITRLIDHVYVSKEPTAACQ